MTKERVSPDFVGFLIYNRNEVKTMQTMNQQLDRSTRCLTRNPERKHQPETDFYPELRSWVQNAIMEAEKRKDNNKRDRLLDLLNDL